MSIVTRGFVDNTIVTRGYGGTGIIPRVVEEIRRRTRRGRSAYGKVVRDVIVMAKLLRYNEDTPDPQIVGKDVHGIPTTDPRLRTRAAAKLIGTEVKKASSQIVIRVTELFDPKDEPDGNN